MFLVYVVLCLICFWLSVPVQLIAWKDSSPNDLLCVEWDVKPYTLTITHCHCVACEGHSVTPRWPRLVALCQKSVTRPRRSLPLVGWRRLLEPGATITTTTSNTLFLCFIVSAGHLPLGNICGLSNLYN